MSKRIAFFLALALLLSAGLAAPSRGSNTLAQGALKQEKASGPAIYIVQLADPPLATYQGGIANLAPTSPRARGEAKLDADSQPARSYRAYLQGKRADALTSIQRAIGAAPEVVFTYDAALNGFAIKLTPAQAAKVAELPGIISVERDTVEQIQTDAGPAFIGAVQNDANRSPALFRAVLNGANERPDPVTTTATGEGVFVYDADTDTLAYQISYRGLSSAFSAAHIHVGDANTAGPVLINLVTEPGTNEGDGFLIGSVTLPAANENDLYTNGLYVNIHTTNNPNGEIRSQITPNKGEGMIVGVLDTGINARDNHPSFAATGADGYTVTNPLGAGVFKGVCDPGAANHQPDFPCTDKLIGAYTFLPADLLPDASPVGHPSPNDQDGHGTHTASTAAGNVVNATTVEGVNTGTISGVAPHANIVAFDVCYTNPTDPTDAGCLSSSTIASINEALLLGVDVINHSIGSTPNTINPWPSSRNIAFLNAVDAGILISNSGGNNGPGAATIGSPANLPWVMSVASTTHDRLYPRTLSGFTGGGTPPPTLTGTGFNPTMTPVTGPIVYAGAAPYNNPYCDDTLAPGTFTNEIVVCDRGGGIGRAAKGANVAAAGGDAVVVVNEAVNGETIINDTFVIPAVALGFNDGQQLKTWLASGAGHQATVSALLPPDVDSAYANILADYSSRGPNGAVPDVIKPDLAAPGVSILAGYVDEGAGAEFNFLNGTSMASPHNAGGAALLRALHPDWSVPEVMSAMILTAVPEGVNHTGSGLPTPFGFGTGRLDLGRAARSGLVMDESRADYLAANPLDGGNPSTLNRPSLGQDTCVVTCTWTRVFSSTLNAPTTWTSTTAADTGMTITVEPSTFTIQPYGTQVVTFTANVGTLPTGTFAFGRVTLTESGNLAPSVSLPVAAQPAQSNLPQQVTIETNTPVGSDPIENLQVQPTISELTVRLAGLTLGEQRTTTLAQDPTENDLYDDLTQVSVQSFEVPAGTRRFVTEVITTSSPDLDLYVHLDGSGATAADGVPQGDELVCFSATADSFEVCDLLDPDAGTYLVLIQNFQSSTAGASDPYTLSTGIVPPINLGNYTVTGPASLPGGTPFDLNVNWNLSRLGPNDRWYGVFDLGASPGTAGGLGTVRLKIISTATDYKIFLPIIDQLTEE